MTGKITKSEAIALKAAIDWRVDEMTNAEAATPLRVVIQRLIYEASSQAYSRGLEDAIGAVGEERLIEPQDETDAAYERALSNAIDAIGALGSK